MVLPAHNPYGVLGGDWRILIGGPIPVTMRTGSWTVAMTREQEWVLDEVGVTTNCKDGAVGKLYKRVPELILGFDTETTGLSVQTERAISYGFCEFRFGVPQWKEQFFVIPDRPITPGAQKVHGLSLETLEAKRANHDVYEVGEGLARALSILGEYHRRGAYIVGSNIVNFDLEMLRRSARAVLGGSSQVDEFDVTQLRIIDVIEHDLLIEPSRAARPRRGQDHLCRFYGVTAGGHDALGDAIAAVEIFLEQVVRNNAGQAAMNLGGNV